MELTLILVFALSLLGLITLLSRRPTGGKLDKVYVANKWEEIMTMARTSEQSARMAVLEADKLVDFVLKAKNFPGNTMGERLKMAKSNLRDNDGIWQAHKLRNRLVHESQDKITVDEVKKAMSGFYRALRDLGAL